MNFQTLLCLDVIFEHKQNYWNSETLQLLVLQNIVTPVQLRQLHFPWCGVNINKHFTLKRTFVVIFADGFIVILSPIALPVVQFTNKHSTKSNILNKKSYVVNLQAITCEGQKTNRNKRRNFSSLRSDCPC